MNQYDYMIGKEIMHDNGPFIVMLFFDCKSPFFMVRNLKGDVDFIKAAHYMVND